MNNVMTISSEAYQPLIKPLKLFEIKKYIYKMTCKSMSHINLLWTKRWEVFIRRTYSDTMYCIFLKSQKLCCQSSLQSSLLSRVWELKLQTGPGSELLRCSTRLAKCRWVNRSLSHQPASDPPALLQLSKNAVNDFSGCLSLANLPTVSTGEISGDKQLLLQIKSIVRRCSSFSPRVFSFSIN